MFSVHPISQLDIASARTAEIMREAALARLARSAVEESPRTPLRHCLGNLLVRTGERLQVQARGSVALDESNVSPGALHLAR